MSEADVTGIGAAADAAADRPSDPAPAPGAGARVDTGRICGRCRAKYARLRVLGTGTRVYCPHSDALETV